MVYGLWLSRNDARESKVMEDPRTLVSRTVALLEEWQSLQNPGNAGSARLVEHCRPPDTGWFKINIDGAFQTADGNGGVIRLKRIYNF
jgi:hypothetical protein